MSNPAPAYVGNYTFTLNDLSDNAKKRYLMAVQSGKPVLDKELTEIAYRDFDFLKKYLERNIGDGALETNSFKIAQSSITTNSNFKITGGTANEPAVLVVKGIPLVLFGDIEYNQQDSTGIITDDDYTETTIAAISIPGSNRIDTVYVDVYFAEVSSDPGSEYQDTSIKDGVLAIQTANRFRIVQDILVAEGTTVIPADGADANSIYHYYYKLAEIQRSTGVANILTADITDFRAVISSQKSISNGTGNIDVYNATVENDLTVKGTVTIINTDISSHEQLIVTTDDAGIDSVVVTKTNTGRALVINKSDNGDAVVINKLTGTGNALVTTGGSVQFSGADVLLENNHALWIKNISGYQQGGGVRFGTDDTLVLCSRSGALQGDRVFVFPDGRVGIGISNTAAMAADEQVRMKGGAFAVEHSGVGTANPTIYLHTFGNSDKPYIKAIANDLTFGTFQSSFEKMRIAANGYVGVGTPVPTELFEVYGSITANTGLKVTGNYGSGIIASFAYPGTGTGGIQVSGFVNHATPGQFTKYQTNEELRITNIGAIATGTMSLMTNSRVGVNSINPQAQLDIVGVTSTNSGLRIIGHQDTNIIAKFANIVNGGNGGIQVSGYSGFTRPGTFEKRTTNEELRISNYDGGFNTGSISLYPTGNVAIGTTYSSDSKFEVYNPAIGWAMANAVFINNLSPNSEALKINSVNGLTALSIFTSSTTYAMAIQSSAPSYFAGPIGIGYTNPADSINVSNSLGIFTNSVPFSSRLGIPSGNVSFGYAGESYVGIGITYAPTSPIQIYTGIATTAAVISNSAAGGTTMDLFAGSGIALKIGTYLANYSLWVNGAKSYFSNSIGIGYTDPANSLNVNQSIGIGTTQCLVGAALDIWAGDFLVELGKAGIGTTDFGGLGLDAALTVNPVSGATYGIRVLGPGASLSQGSIYFGDAGYVFLDEYADDYLRIAAANGLWMDTQFVGIGSQPTGNFNVEVVGNLVSTSGFTGARAILNRTNYGILHSETSGTGDYSHWSMAVGGLATDVTWSWDQTNSAANLTLYGWSGGSRISTALDIIKSTGRIGMGTTANAFNRLAVSGNVSCTQVGIGLATLSTPVSYPLDVVGNSRLIGSVGIGTTPDASYALHSYGHCLMTNGTTYFNIGTFQYGTISCNSPASNYGLAIGAFTPDTGVHPQALVVVGRAMGPDTATATTATGVINFKAYAYGGGNYADNENLFVISSPNLTTLRTKFIVKGNGDIYTDTGFIGSYDEEDDLKLVDTAKNMLGGWSNKVMSQYKDKLEELGIIENGFMSHNKMTALMLGAFGQMTNMVKGLAKKLGITEDELFAMAHVS
ncbi:MAG: hypothetical protein Q7R33_02010 [Nitrosarchaeum sp.]|nr:hypothetical protein [Nitrosarchaeum sp.]